MYASEIVPGVNYENLFLLYNQTLGPTSDPPSNSLFDLDNLKMLINLGKNTTNIMVDTSAIYDVDFTLDEKWDLLR